MTPDSLDKRLALIEERLSALESRARETPNSPHALPDSEEIWDEEDTIPAPLGEQTPSASLGEKSLGNWLGIVAIICFILAAGFIVKLSIDTGWLTPLRQLGLAALLGFSLIGTGFKLMSSEREYAALLPASGIIVFHLTNFAAYQIHSLISLEVALGLVSAISGFCIFLYTRIRHDIYPIVASAGAYLSPFILDLHPNTDFSLYYYLLCSVAFASISVFVKSRTLTLVSSYLSLMMTALAGFSLHHDSLVALILGLHFLVFTTGVYCYSREHGTALREDESYSFMPVLLIFYAVEYYFVDRISPQIAPYISLCFSALLTGLYISSRAYFNERLGSRTLIVAFVTLSAFHAVYLELCPPELKPWLFVALMLGIAFFPTAHASPSTARLYAIPLLALTVLAINEYATMLYHLRMGASLSWVTVSLAELASLWAVIVRHRTRFGSDQEGYYYLLLGAAHLLAVVGFYRLTEDTGSLAVSASWLFYSVGVIGFSFVRKDAVMAKSALFVLTFAAGKALLYDAASAPTIVRILCLLLTGAVLYGCGFLMKKIGRWEKVPAPSGMAADSNS